VIDERPILVTGGRGMLARAVVAALSDAGRQVVALGQRDCDITSEADLRRVFDSHQPSIVINCAAHTNVDQAEDEPELANAVNGNAVGKLAAAARQYDAYLVHYSTDAVFDGRSTRPYVPSDPTNPLSAYAKSKLLGEQRLLAHAPRRWLIIRTAWLFGIGGVCFPRTIIERAQAGAALKVVNDQFGSPTYCGDLAAATLKLIDSGATGIYHVTNSGSTSWFDLAAATLEAFGLQADLSPVTTEQWLAIRPKQALRPRYTVLDLSATEALIGPMPNWKDALKRYRSESPLCPCTHGERGRG
jgi:dTDP-4-dehydrorhamnose reductase